MVKLVIQIPCYNEEGTIGLAISELPRSIAGIDEIEVVIINDGSKDNTVAAARKAGAKHIVSHTTNKGLADAYMTGLEYSLQLGADIVVNTDADNQYCGADIKSLVQPILRGEADIVVGCRPITEIEHFSPLKKLLQRFGSRIVRLISVTTVADVTSGFRAVSREAARRLFVYNRYTYTIETIIQAGQQNLKVESVSVRTNRDLRPSRLIRSIPQYILSSVITMIRVYITYRPMRFFAALTILVGIPGTLLVGRFMFFYLRGESGYIQSLQVGTGLIIISLLFFVAGLLADLSSVNRRLLEDLRWKIGRLEDRVRRMGDDISD
jgi:glycosyltransferase involved in cell wall biosynthesis